MEYYSAMRKMEFVTIWRVLEDITLSKISQTKTNTVCYHLYVESTKSQIHRNRKNGGYQGQGWEKLEDVGQRVQTSSEKMNNF